jgi:hypothetical protein
MPNESSGGGGIGGTLKAKLGPLPTWAWLAIVTVVLLGYWLYEQHKNATTAGTQAPTPASVGQPGVVVINQDSPDTDTTPAATPPGTTPPTPPENTRQITVTKNETLGQLAKQRHWSAATLKQVEQDNVTQGGGHWTTSTRLKKGEEVVRPLG